MVLDVRGERCPTPALKTLEALPRLAPDEELEVITDYEPAPQTITAYVARLGYRTRVEALGTGTWKVTVARAP